MASKPHHSQPGSYEEPPAKRARPEDAASSLFPRKPCSPFRAELNPADCDLDFDVSGDGLQGHALHEGGFAYCWSGARATVGITGGKYCFGCKIISEQVADVADIPSDQQHLCRVGISRGDDPVGNLGETEHSYGFGGTGKFSSAGKFSDYGTKFGVGDTIVCAVDLENKPFASIAFSKNGQHLGIARHFDASSKGLGVVDTALQDLPWESALFPHVMLKNVVVQLQFCLEDGLLPEVGYKPWNSALTDGNAILGPIFTSQRECEVLMMVGLPASGKTTWAEKWVKEHPEKRYVVLGTNLALDQMKVPGLLRKHNYGERFERLMDRATGIFNTLLARAAKIPRNYIIDQTNVYKSARNRKLRTFSNYRKIAVVLFPSQVELKFRAEKRFKEMGKEVPAEAVNEMIANFVLPMTKDMPGSNEYFDEVMFPELCREEAQRHLDEMRHALGSPCMNSKKESSSQTYSSPYTLNKGAASVAGDYRTSRHVSLPSLGNLNNQVDPSYSALGYLGDSWTRSGAPGIHLPIGRPYGSSSYGWPPLNAAEHGPYGNYGGSNPYTRTSGDLTRQSNMTRCQTYGATETFRRPDFDSLSSFGKDNYGYPSTMPFYSAEPCYSGSPCVGNPVQREPPSEWCRPAQDAYGLHYARPPYATPPSRPPYATPPSRPQYRAHPPNQINPRPGSWYH
ncbi:uncharacterized protein [Typha angustifolia]|uniref:uncharacterized protein n=1 Tax=Typha angustifolia TaxID=59011 RepID=UPI003C2CB852